MERVQGAILRRLHTDSDAPESTMPLDGFMDTDERVGPQT